MRLLYLLNLCHLNFMSSFWSCFIDNTLFQKIYLCDSFSKKMNMCILNPKGPKDLFLICLLKDMYRSISFSWDVFGSFTSASQARLSRKSYKTVKCYGFVCLSKAPPQMRKKSLESFSVELKRNVPFF